MRESDRVVLTTGLPEYGLQPGDTGTMVLEHAGGAGYEVEFTTLSGDTVAVVTLLASQVRAISPRENPRAQTVDRPAKAASVSTASGLGGPGRWCPTSSTRNRPGGVIPRGNPLALGCGVPPGLLVRLCDYGAGHHGAEAPRRTPKRVPLQSAASVQYRSLMPG